MGYIHLAAPRALGALQPDLFDVGKGVLSQLELQHMQELEKALKSVSAKVSEDMKAAMIQMAAVQLGTQLVLMAIPVVGWAAAAVVGIVQAFTGGAYEKEAKQILTEAQSDISVMQAESQVRITKRLGEVFKEEQQPAIDMILATAIMAGREAGVGRLVDTVKGLMDPLHSFLRSAADELRSAMKTIDNFAGDVIDNITGRVAVTEARDAAKKLKKTAQEKIDTHEREVMALVDTPAYRVNLRDTIATEILKDPSIQQMVTQVGKLQQALTVTTRNTPLVTAPPITAPKSSSVVPLAVGAAALAAMFLLSD